MLISAALGTDHDVFEKRQREGEGVRNIDKKISFVQTVGIRHMCSDMLLYKDCQTLLHFD